MDAGALLGATDRVIGLTRRLAGCFTDARHPAFVEHAVEALLMQRVFGIALGYEDLVDHDELRHDPVLAILAGKLAALRGDCAPLAGKSTLNRLELGQHSMPDAGQLAGNDHDGLLGSRSVWAADAGCARQPVSSWAGRHHELFP